MASACEHDMLKRVVFYGQTFYRCANSSCQRLFKPPVPAVEKKGKRTWQVSTKPSSS